MRAGSLQGRALLPAPPPGSVAGERKLPRQRAAAAGTARRSRGASRITGNAPVAAHGRERVRARRPRPLPHGRPARPGGRPRWRRHGRPRRRPPPARRPRRVRAPHPLTPSPLSMIVLASSLLFGLASYLHSVRAVFFFPGRVTGSFLVACIRNCCVMIPGSIAFVWALFVVDHLMLLL